MKLRRGSGGSRRLYGAGGGSLLANLAEQPFVNKRPVQRFVMAAWAVSAVLIGINIALWVNYRHESTSLRTRLASTRAEIEIKSKSVVEMDQELRGLRLGAQNSQVAFLNARIAERTFPWSLLFERIAATLPDGVRLKGLNPVFARDDKARTAERERRSKKAGAKGAAAEAKAAPPEELVNLKLLGSAKSDDSLYQLVDALFASPSFASPRLHQESSSGAEVDFTVDVDYRARYTPESSHRPAVAAEGETTDDGSDDEATSDLEMAAEGMAAEEPGAEDAGAQAAGGDAATSAEAEAGAPAAATRSSQSRSDDERKRAQAANAGPRRHPTSAPSRASDRDRSDEEEGD